MRVVSYEETERGKSVAGGWKRKTLKSWGVSWPPRKGWRDRLAKGVNPNIETKDTKNTRKEWMRCKSDDETQWAGVFDQDRQYDPMAEFQKGCREGYVPEGKPTIVYYGEKNRPGYLA
jgi:hypothetical protein